MTQKKHGTKDILERYVGFLAVLWICIGLIADPDPGILTNADPDFTSQKVEIYIKNIPTFCTGWVISHKT
jgi:hypothetical protein